MKGRGTLQGGEPHHHLWVVLGLHCCLRVCCCRLAACHHRVSWSCHCGAALLSSVVVPCCCHPCPDHIVVVLCVSKVGWDELRGVLTMVL